MQLNITLNQRKHSCWSITTINLLQKGRFLALNKEDISNSEIKMEWVTYRNLELTPSRGFKSIEAWRHIKEIPHKVWWLFCDLFWNCFQCWDLVILFLKGLSSENHRSGKQCESFYSKRQKEWKWITSSPCTSNLL